MEKIMLCNDCSENVIEQIDVVSKIRTTYKYSYELLACFSLIVLVVEAQEGHHHHVFDYYVTPTGRHCLSYDDESWKTAEENASKSKESSPDIARSTETRQSKTKRVKNYLKKCKNALGSRSSTIEITSETPSSSWYVEQQVNESEINEIQDEFHECVSLDQAIGAETQVATLVEVKHPYERKSDFTKVESAENLRNLGVAPSIEVSSSPLLPDVQESVEGVVVGDVEEGNEVIKNDVASLVDRYFGALYENYKITRKCLVRQARDLLVCEYHGCLQKFEEDFCEPAAVLLQHIKDENVENGCAPKGWPLSLGDSGLVIHLGSLTPTLIRNKDCYVCIRNRSAPGLEVAVVWRRSGQINCRTLAEFKSPLRHHREVVMCSRLSTAMDLEAYAFATDDSDGVELPELLQNLLVSIEHVIQRVPLDHLTFPCPQCLQYLPLDRQDDVQDCAVCSCQCSCRPPEAVVLKKDTSIQTSPMFEFAGSIPHIDSDEDDDKVSIKSGSSSSSKKSPELVVKPRRITDLPEKLLMSGINLPGTADVDGRPLILCYAECITRAGLNKYEVAKLILYYASVSSAESISKGFTVLLLAETEDYNKVLELLDKAAILLGNFVKISKLLVWRPGTSSERNVSTSRNQVVVISNESSLFDFIRRDQAPASCGGDCNHDQLEWVEFFKQLEPFLATCRAAGRALLSALSQLRNEDVPLQVTRRFLNHQCRQISRAIQLELVQKLRRDGHTTLTSLEERTQWLSGSRDVRRSCSFAAESFSSVNRVAKRLEQLAQERKERLKELARLRSLQDEIEEVLLWISAVGEETLGTQVVVLRTGVDLKSVKAVEKEFEKFYFNAMKQIDKASDLIEESTNIALEESRNVPNVKGKSLKESANNLKAQVKTFGDRLEEIRECLEACSRCFQLLDSCHDILEDDCKEQEEFKRLAFKSSNEKLIQICKSAKTCESAHHFPKDLTSSAHQHEATATSTPIKSQNTQIRRRSVSSYAFIYKCNHHAAGVSCNCCESDTENTVSYKLKKKYMQTLQSCPCNNVVVVRDAIERKNSVTLDGIKEVRESVENLLEKLDKNEERCGRCDSGVSTADNSVGDDSGVYKKNLQRTCSCQFYRESCVLCSTNSSSTGSNQDHTENQQDSIIEEGSDGFVKSGSDDIEDEHFAEARRKVPPVPSNSHLHCHSSTFDLPSDAFDQTTEPKTLKTLLYIMREMIQTERDYVSSLDYVIENYIPELLREDIPQALRGQRNVVFGNIEKIFEFHSQHFLRELEQCELQPLNVGQIFLTYQKKFYLYALYNKNKPKSDSLMSEYGSTFFKSKQIQLEDKMDLASYLLKPVQRMGKYALLLQQMMKACPALPPGASERAVAEQDDIKQAEQMVRFQLRHGNDLLAMDSIRECDVNLKEQGRLLRQSEFLLWEGKTGKKSLRQVFLFEELILFSKARRFPDRKNLDLFIYKNSIKMTDIGLTARIGESPTKFEIWFRKRKPNDTYILQSMNEDVKKAWSEELSQLLWKQAIRNREVRMAEMSSMGIGNKPCLDIRPSADQINDRSISFAQLSRTAPRFRNSIVGPVTEQCRSSKRPHSVISMSSVSSGSTSSGSSSGTSGSTTIGPSPLINVGFDSSCDSPKPYHRSGTLNSQCSTESGIIADISLGSDDCHDNQHNTGWTLEKSNSQHSNISQKSTSAQSDDTTQVNSSGYHMQDDISINM